MEIVEEMSEDQQMTGIRRTPCCCEGNHDHHYSLVWGETMEEGLCLFWGVGKIRHEIVLMATCNARHTTTEGRNINILHQYWFVAVPFLGKRPPGYINKFISNILMHSRLKKFFLVCFDK